MSIMKIDLLMTLLKFINLIKSCFIVTIIEAQVPRVRQAVIAAVGAIPFQLLRPLLEITLVKMKTMMMTIIIHFIPTRRLPLARTPKVIDNRTSSTTAAATAAAATAATIYYYRMVFIQSSLIVILPPVIIYIRATVTPVPKEKDW